MKAFSLKNISLGRKQNVCGYIMLGISFMLLSFLTVKFLAPDVDSSAASQTAEQTVGPHTMSMSNDSAATINITPTDTQTVYSATNNLSVTNSCTAGATITMKTSGTSNALTRPAVNNDTLTKTIAATTGTSLADNSWGFSKDSGSTWAAVPASNGTAATVYDETRSRTSAYSVPVMFGVKVDNSIPSGAYTNDVIYTMTPKAGCLTYSVTWNMNGGTAKSGATYPSSLNWGQTVNLSTLTPTRNGYTFTGWSNGSSTYTASQTAANINSGNNLSVTMTAQWTANVYNFDYTGGQQTWIVPFTGYYKLETWGAEGGYAGNTSYRGGYGAYSIGIYNGTKNQTLYVNVGGKGANATTYLFNSGSAYNGGGASGKHEVWMTGGGGGLTHIATMSGQLRNIQSSSNKVLIVASGGGGGSYCDTTHGGYAWTYYGRASGGDGGGIIGSNGSNISSGVTTYYVGTGGTQSSGGSTTSSSSKCASGGFGFGGYETASSEERCGAGGGGGGWYGGGAGFGLSGGGGSGYIGSSNLISGGGITKHMTCYSCTTSTAAATRTNSNTNAATSTATADRAKLGNGYARITYLGTSI